MSAINYRIAWFIDIEASSPLEAAQIARGIQLDAESIATVFTVQGPEGSVCIDAENGQELPSDAPGFWAGSEEQS